MNNAFRCTEAKPCANGLFSGLDSHVRVDHSNDAKLSRRYVSRQKLCLRGTTDYWINDALGRPFFVVSKAITETQVPCPGGGTIPIRLARRETELTARKAVPVPLLEVNPVA